MDFIPQQDAAKRLNTTEKSVSEWVRRFKLKQKKRGKIRLIDFDELRKHLHTVQSPVVADPQVAQALSFYRASVWKTKAEREQLELARIKGEMVSRAEVVTDWTQLLPLRF